MSPLRVATVITDFGSMALTCIRDEISPTGNGFPSLSVTFVDFPASTVASNGGRSLLVFQTLIFTGWPLSLVKRTWPYMSSCACAGRLANNNANPAKSANRRLEIMHLYYGLAVVLQED